MSTPINLLQNPGHSATQLQTQKVEMAQNEIKGLGQSKLSDAEKAAKLRDTCENFESIFIQKMWQQMRETLPQENPLVGKEEKFWQSMYDQEFSKKMAQSGGIGLADMMYDQLSENLFNVSKTTAHASSDGKGFEINPAPIMPIQSQHASGAVSGTALDQGQKQLDSQDASQLSASGSTSSGGQKYAGLYEDVQPQTVSQGTDTATVAQANTTAGQNTAAVQQFLAGLQSKQGGQVTQGSNTLTGPERAQQVQHVVGSPPPAHGVLPSTAMGSPQVLRTTYTTNVPKSERQGDAESHMRDLMAKAARQQAQPLQGQQPWLQATPQQQASNAVQDALRKAQDAVATQQTAQSLPLTPVSSQSTTAVTSPYAVPPMTPTTNKQQS